MSQEKTDALVRQLLRMLADPDAGPPDLRGLTEDELDAAWTEAGRRVSSAMDRGLARLAEKLPNLTAAEWEVIDREFQATIAPLRGKPPGLN
jgi:hypothetical protein